MIFSFLLRIGRLAAFFIISLCRAVHSSFLISLAGRSGCVAKGSVCTTEWAKAMARIIGLKVTVHGNPDSVRGGLIVSNHVSYVDIISHSSVFNVRFSPKSDLRGWPFIGWLVSLNRPIWIDRESKQASRKTLADFKETMEQGINLLVYPEGTTTSGKNHLLRFKSTPFQAVISGNFPIFPVLTVYRQKDGDPTVAWYGEMDFLPHLWNILGIREINVEMHILKPVYPEGHDRKRLAEQVQRIMQEKFLAMTGQAHPARRGPERRHIV